MIFVSGTKTRRKKLGWVADFCTTCQEPTPFKLFSIRRAKHVYYLPTSNQGTVGHETRCSKCKAKHPANPLRYSGASRVAGVNIAVLAEETNPILSGALAAGACVEDLYRTRDTVASDLATEVAAALHEGYTAVQRRRESGPIDAWTVLALFGFVIGFGWTIMAAGNSSQPTLIDTAAYILGGVSAIAVLTAANTAQFRFAKRTVVPGIQGAISCLHASPEDVRAAATRLKRLDIDVKKMFSRKVFDQIEASLSGTAFPEKTVPLASRKAA